MAYRRALRRTQRDADASKRAQLIAPVAPPSRYETMSYADIRTLAISYGISGKQTREALISAIEDYLQ